MDRWSKCLIGATAIALICYFFQVYGDCALDPHCHVRMCGRHVCGLVHDGDAPAPVR